MSFRSAELAIQPKTKQRLRMAIKLYQLKLLDESAPAYDNRTRTMSPDELGDQFINGMIQEKYPKVIELERELAKTEKRYIEQCNRATNPEMSDEARNRAASSPEMSDNAPAVNSG